ncbi:TPA: CTP synthase [Candidatus Beckwithbacteria bacterium]|nr:CTP synthase [Candidatus Beckwithbacteria bacterium]
MPQTRYIFVSGGVLSGLGKGLITGAISLLLKSTGLKVVPVKCENYLNFDAGLINPIEHGDPFLCADGAETDMDIGTYEMFLNTNLSIDNFITLGQIYKTVIDRERNFDYGGEDVEAIPHVTDEIIRKIKAVGKKDQADVVVVELGGTAGDYQNILYYEASRIMKLKHHDTVVHVHVSYLPTPPHLGEPKTKPTQLSVKQLNSMGIQPDFIVARADRIIDKRRRERFALFCNLEAEDIISSPDVANIYELPLIFDSQNLTQRLRAKLGLKPKKPQLKDWHDFIKKTNQKKIHSAEIAIVGKYFSTGDYHLTDSYRSLVEALRHAAANSRVDLKIREINSQKLNRFNVKKLLAGVDGIIVPIGWGPRGVSGMIQAIRYAREEKIPYLGLCFGMQLSVVEFAQNVAQLKGAHSTEIKPKTAHPVIHIIPAQLRNLKARAYGGTMRLGSWRALVSPKTLAWQIYNRHRGFINKRRGLTEERHRHRYEFNRDYLNRLRKAGLVISARALKEDLVEIIELPRKVHPFFLGTQGHPEYKSRPLFPHPIFIEYLKAASAYHSRGGPPAGEASRMDSSGVK